MRYLQLLLLILFTGIANAADVDYLRDVKPILHERCFACHGALKQESGLRLDTGSLIRQGGDGGLVIEAGNAAASSLIERIAAASDDERMPPEGKPLTAAEIESLKKWIDAGAISPTDEKPDEDPAQHWAFQLPTQRDLPQPKDLQWSHNPVDAFIAAERDSRNLKTVPFVVRPLLLRRVYLDLIGLPPTREQMQAFLDDTRDDAYERVVDELLESPHYGERWGRHWMDVWRYSDWFGVGAQLRNSQKHIWHWRDWIVESLNEDKGYDRMIVEMLAADEVAPTDRDALRATGFLARNYYLFNRTTWLDETIEHTSQAFLGLTLNCAKCHDHKYDPLSQVDYYRMRAVFEPHQVRLDAMPGQTDFEKDGLPRVFDAHPDEPTYLHIRGDAANPDQDRVITPGVPKVLTANEPVIKPIELPAESHNPAVLAFVLEDHLQVAEQQIAAAEHALVQSQKVLASLDVIAETAQSKAASAPTTSASKKQLTVEQARLAVLVAERSFTAVEARLAALRTAHAADVAKHQLMPPENLPQLIHEAAAAARALEAALADRALAVAAQALADTTEQTKAKAEQDLQTAQAKLDKARTACEQPGEHYTSIRGSIKALEGPGEKDDSRFAPYPRTSTGRRTALARWIADSKNPLTARVAVNHIWTRHFGQPLVESVTDFGRRASKPAQQALLDWLAVDFMSHDWSMKHLHRVLVTSQTYRLSTSLAGSETSTREIDPENEYYWRRLPTRMEAQVVRDSLLQLAGVLDPTLGGPTIDPSKEDTAYRRSLYFTHSRDDQHKFLTMFDDAEIDRCYRRDESIVPQQALTLANSKLSLTLARKMAEKLQSELGEVSDEQFAVAAFRMILASEPSRDETEACLDSLRQMREALAGADHPQRVWRARADLIHALLNHNDFVTIR